MTQTRQGKVFVDHVAPDCTLVQVMGVDSKHDAMVWKSGRSWWVTIEGQDVISRASKMGAVTWAINEIGGHGLPIEQDTEY